jgi:deoxycytidine triphosphate deaminase
LSGTEIKRRNLISGAFESSFRAASYDLRVGTIFARDENDNTIEVEQYDLPPQGMIEVISVEKLTLPENVMGFATVKTGLADQCVLATGIGLIDPTWKSFVSSTLVNFGTAPCPLKQGDVFLRVTFQEYHVLGNVEKIRIPSDEEYRAKKREKVVLRYSRTFLNLEHTAGQALRDQVPKIALWAGVIALIVTIITAVGTIGIGIGFAYIASPPRDVQTIRELRESDYRHLEQEFLKTQEQLKQVSENEKKLEEKIQQRPTSTPRTPAK